MAQKKAKNNHLVRINKYIADSGIASRRAADELIKEGQVKVNGITVKEQGLKIDPSHDSVKVGRKLIKPEGEKFYYMFNKPAGVLTSTSDPEGRPTVLDYFEDIKARIFPVGRLDWDTEGLLLLTNDGTFSQNVIHPSKGIPKTYLAKLDSSPSQEKLNKLLRGVSIIGGKVKALHVEKIKKGSSEKYSWVKIIITEGKNRQVRKMFEKIGCDVLKLQRVAIGQLTLGKLKKGAYKKMTRSQLMSIFAERKAEEKPVIRKNRRPTKKKVSTVKSKKDYFKKIRKQSK